MVLLDAKSMWLGTVSRFGRLYTLKGHSLTKFSLSKRLGKDLRVSCQ